MHLLAAVYAKAGRLQEAIALNEQTLEQRKASLGPNNPQTLGNMLGLGYMYHRAGKFDEADRLLRDLLVRRRKTDGPKAIDTAGALATLGLNLLKQERF